MDLGLSLSGAAEPIGLSSVVHLMERYQNAYRVAAAACGLGTAAKGIGVIAGAGVLMWSGQTVTALRGIAAGYTVGVVFGFSALALFWLLGTLVSALGEHLRAALDTAVYTSTFLDNAQRAKIMSLD